MVNYLDGELLYEAFISGAKAVRSEREYLNKINVFPVPDGDTGNNLAVTLNSLVTVTPDKALGKSLRSIAQATLAGARGNSGVIFAGFVNGLTVSVADAPVVSTRSFAEMVHEAVPHACRAISNPVEGTMITVMRDWAQAVHAIAHKTNDFVELFNSTLDVARASLEATPQKLKVLRDALVVDSGAKGFVLFLEGFSSSLINAGKGVDEMSETAMSTPDGENANGNGSQIAHRYCTEAFITGENLDIEEIRALAERSGDSVVVAGGSNGVKVHFHTNDPQSFFMAMRRKGEFVSQKVEDMLRQYQMIHQRKAPIALVTDSIADLPQGLLDEHQVHVVPLNVMIEGNTFLDKLTIKPDRFYSLLNELKEYPTSAQPNQVYVAELFAQLRQHYESIIAVSVSQELSGTFNVFQQAAKALQAEEYPITVINSRLNSGAQGLLVLRAAELISAGHTHKAVVKAVEAAIPDSYIYVSVVDFQNMVRGGRVSPLKGTAARLLNMNPVVSLDKQGKGIAFATTFSRSAVQKKILALVTEHATKQGVASFSVVHSNSETKANEFAAEIGAIVGQPASYVSEISPIVGISAGIGAVAVSLICDPARKGA